MNNDHGLLISIPILPPSLVCPHSRTFFRPEAGPPQRTPAVGAIKRTPGTQTEGRFHVNTVDNLGKEAKRWLKALRGGDTHARARLVRAYPTAPAEPTLRDIQHALARASTVTRVGCC